MRFLGIPVPRALPWADMLFPLRGGIPESRNIETRRRGDCHFPLGRAPGPTPTRRASFDVAPLGRRPEGAVTNQPRATPWDHVQQPRPSPERAKQNSVFHVRLRRRNSRELRRPYRACASSESRFPGRCPGLACRFPFGAEFRIAQHRNAASRGLPFPVPSARAGPIPTRRASFDVAAFGSSPRRGSHKSAQGNALGPRQAATSLP